jgi:rubredoxin
MIQFLRRWLIEIVAGAAAILGLFLLFEQTDISETLWDRLAGFWIGVGQLITQVMTAIRLIQLSDVLGIGLIVFAVVLLLRQSAQKIQDSPNWSARACPECGHSLRRERRRPGDIATWFLPVRRYRCRNCGWAGLRAKPSSPEEFAEPRTTREPQ